MAKRSIAIEYSGRVPFAARKTLPDEPGVYFIIDGEEIYYVGQTVSLKKRCGYSQIYNHPMHSIPGVSNFEIAYMLLPKEKLLETETEYIKTIKPAFNQMHTGDGSKSVHIRLTYGEESIYKRIAAEDGANFSDFVRSALGFYVRFRDSIAEIRE